MGDDYYNRGFELGRRGHLDYPFEVPVSDCDKYDFEKGREDGEWRRRVAGDLDDEEG